MKKFKYFCIFSFFILLILSILFFVKLKDVKEHELEKAKKIQKRVTDNFSNLLKDFVVSNGEKVSEFSIKLIEVNDKKKELELLKAFYNYNEDIYSIQIYDSNKRLKLFYPPSSIPKKIKVDELPEMKRLIDKGIVEKKILFTSIFTMKEGGKGFGIFVPLFDKGIYVKSVFVIYKIPYFLEKIKKETFINLDYEYSIIDKKFNVVYFGSTVHKNLKKKRITSESCFKCHLSMGNFKDIFFGKEKFWIEKLKNFPSVIGYSKKIKIYNQEWVVVTSSKLSVIEKKWHNLLLVSIYFPILLFITFLSFYVMIILYDKEIQRLDEENRFLKREIDKKEYASLFEKITELMETLNVGVFIHDGKDFVFLNSFLKKMLGFEENFEFLERLPHEFRQLFENSLGWEKSIKSFESPISVKISSDTGNERFLEFILFPSVIGKEKHVIGIIRDVTTQQKLYNQLQLETNYNFQLFKISRVIFEKENEKDLLKTLLTELHNILDLGGGHIFDFTKKEEVKIGDIEGSFSLFLSKDEIEIISEKVVENHRSLLITDVNEPVPWEISKIVREENIQNFIAIPLFDGNVAKYVIVLFNKNSFEKWGVIESKFFGNLRFMLEIFLKKYSYKVGYTTFFQELLMFIPCGLVIVNENFEKIIFSNQKAWDMLGDRAQTPEFFKEIYEFYSEDISYNQFVTLEKLKIDGKYLNFRFTVLEGSVSNYIFLIEEIMEDMK